MITTQEKISRLEALLARVTARALEPRAPRTSRTRVAEPAFVDPAPIEAPIEAASEAPIEAAIEAAPIAVSLGPAAIEPIEASADLTTTLDLSQPADLTTTLDAPPRDDANEPQELAAAAIDLDAPFELSARPLSEPPRVEATSGEFAVAKPALDVEAPGEVALDEEPLELEELGPADELGDEPVVEIHVDDEVAPAAAEPIALEAHENALEAPPEARDGLEDVEERAPSSPPESGRELVASPYESARLAVAAPSTPDVGELELVEEPIAPPESSRNLRAAPAVPSTSDVVEVDGAAIEPAIEATAIEPVVEATAIEPVVEADAAELEPLATRETVPQELPDVALVAAPIEPAAIEVALVEPAVEAPPDSEPPVTRVPYADSEPPPTRVSLVPSIPSRREEPLEPALPLEPVQAAVAVRLEAPSAHAPRDVEHVVVAVAADVIHPQLTPVEVAAIVSAVRAPRPETFGGLLDAALDL